MKKVAGFILVLAFSSSVFATEDKVVESVMAVCQSPSQQGKYWNVDMKGDAGANGLIRLIGVGINGEADFTKGEWEGVQQVLKEQQSTDNANYRDCAVKLTPLFLEKFAAAKPVNPNKTKSNSVQKTKDNKATATQPSGNHQETHGDKSPAINSKGDVTINY